MLKINKKPTEEKKKSTKRRKKLLNNNAATNLLQGTALVKRGEEMVEDARLQLDKAIVKDVQSSGQVEEGYTFDADHGEVVVDLRKPIAFSQAKREAAVDLGIDYENTFPIASTNPVLLWNMIERAGISAEAELILKLLDRAVNDADAKTLLTHQAQEVTKNFANEDGEVDWGGNAVDVIEKRELSDDLSALSYLKSVAKLPSAEVNTFVESIGINTTVKCGKTTKESKQTTESYKDKILLV